MLTNTSVAMANDQSVIIALGGESLQNVQQLLSVFGEIDYHVFLQL